MTDIVERLRARKGFWLNGSSWMMATTPDEDCKEAADEIERLREKMREIAHCEHCEGGDHLTLADMGQGWGSAKGRIGP